MFVDGPKVRRAIAPRLKNEILSVRSPFAAAFVGSIAPTRQQKMKIAAVRGGFRDRAVIGLGIVDGETQNRSVGRPANIVGSSARF
jgi:hypothetical protein